MSKLLYAELHRFFRYKLYWITCAAVILFSVYFVLLQDYSIPPDAGAFLFYCMPVSGAVSAIVISQFIGIEYSSGTIRNKLFTGYTRTEIYLTELIIAFLGNISVLNLAILFVVISNWIRRYHYNCSFSILLGCYAMCVCTLFLISAISVLVSCLNSSNMANLIVLLAIWLCLSMIGSDCNSKLGEPELREPYAFEAEKGQTGFLQNELYVTGEMRKCYEYMLLINPYGHTNYEFEAMYDRYQEYRSSKILEHPLFKIFIFSIVEGIIFTAIGLIGFKRKEIK